MLNEEPNIFLDYDPGYGGSLSGREHWTKEQSDKELRRLSIPTIDQNSYDRGYKEGQNNHGKGYKEGVRDGLKRKEENFINLHQIDRKTLERIKQAVVGTNLEAKVDKILKGRK